MVGRVFFPRYCSTKLNSESVMGVKPGDSGIVIGYQVDTFITPCQWSNSLLDQTFILVSQVRCSQWPTSTKLWGLFLFGPGSGRLSTSLDSIHMECQHTRTGNIPWWGWCHAFFSLFSFLCSVSTMSDASRQQLFIMTLWCQAMDLLLHVLQAGKMSALSCYFFSHPAAFRSRLLHHQIISL